MSLLRAHLFGQFRVRYDGGVWYGPEGQKSQELFCYLLIHRDKKHHREQLASFFWGDCPTAQARKNLRQVLWQLQSTFNARLGPTYARFLSATSERVQINPEIELWTDVAIFEQAFASLHQSGAGFNSQCAQTLRAAAQLYQGDLLEGWYQNWCLCERERLQGMYLVMLDRLSGYCEARQEYETGLEYCARVLQLDPAREHTHQQMMRLYHLRGDRTSALRQFDRCVEALKEELDVQPTQRTLTLYEQIRADQLESAFQTPLPVQADRNEVEAPGSLPALLRNLKQVQAALTDLQLQVQRNIQLVERSLPDCGREC